MTSSHPTTSRRSILKTGAALAGAIAAPAVLRGAAEAQEKILYVNTWGGGWTAAEDEAYYKSFTQETGVQIKAVSPVSFAKLKSQVQSGTYEWDCSTFNSAELIQADKEGLVEHIDWSVVDRSALYPKGGIFKDLAVVTAVLSCNLGYRKDKFPNGGPKNWADFWDVKKFPQKRAMWDRSYTSIAFALLADGVTVDKLYPLDLNRAFKKLDEIKPHIKVWYTQGGQIDQLVRDAEVDMLPVWGSRAPQLIQSGVPLEMVWEGAEAVATNWCVAKGTPRAKLAWQFVASCAKPERLAKFCEKLNYAYGPIDPRALDFIKPEFVQSMPTTPEHAKIGFFHDADWLAEQLPTLRDRWSQWLAS